MKITPLNRENIGYVFEDLSDTSKGDALALGMTEEEMKKGFIDAIGTPFSAAFYAAFYNRLGECCSLFRVQPVSNSVWRAYFVDRAGSLRAMAFALTKFFKQISDNLLQKDGITIEFQSRFGSGKSAEWFGLMGFKSIGSIDGIITYIKQREG